LLAVLIDSNDVPSIFASLMVCGDEGSGECSPLTSSADYI